MELIDKSALVAKINKRIMDAPIDCYGHQRVWAYNDVKDIISTIEVKEVDLKKEYKDFVEKDPVYNKLVNGIVGKAIAKHFFELGLQART